MLSKPAMILACATTAAVLGATVYAIREIVAADPPKPQAPAPASPAPAPSEAP